MGPVAESGLGGGISPRESLNCARKSAAGVWLSAPVVSAPAIPQAIPRRTAGTQSRMTYVAVRIALPAASGRRQVLAARRAPPESAPVLHPAAHTRQHAPA